MNREELIKTLRESENILPQELLKNATIDRLTTDLVAIFESNFDDLQTDQKFRNNFTELVNYIYLLALDKRSQSTQRKKDPFNDRLITFLLTSPNPL